jgi:hypothetical protein
VSVLDYSDEQLLVLAELMPKVLRGLRDGGPEAAEAFERLDDWCWHVPPCEPNEECVAGEMNNAMRGSEQDKGEVQR